MKNKIGIYKITNIKNNKIYIGSSERIHGRWVDHIGELTRGKHPNKHLLRAWIKNGKQSFTFEIIEECTLATLIEREQYYLDNLLFAQEYIRKENKKFLQLGYNINPTAGKNRKGTHQSKAAIKKTIKNSNRKRKIIVVDINNNKIEEFDYIFELLNKYKISSTSFYNALNKKQFTKKNIGFMTKEDYLKDIKLKNYRSGNKKGTSYKGKKRAVDVFTVYGEFVESFEDLYQCAKFFHTTPSSVFVKLNRKISKKILIDSMISRYIIVDKNTSMDEYTKNWRTIFQKLKDLNGKYTIYDCFDNFIGRGEIKDIANILSIKRDGLYSCLGRNSYIKSLKIKL